MLSYGDIFCQLEDDNIFYFSKDNSIWMEWTEGQTGKGAFCAFLTPFSNFALKKEKLENLVDII